MSMSESEFRREYLCEPKITTMEDVIGKLMEARDRQGKHASIFFRLDSICALLDGINTLRAALAESQAECEKLKKDINKMPTAMDLQEAYKFYEAKCKGFERLQSELAASQAECERLRESQAWRLIATAPIDGSHILLFRPYIQFVGYFSRQGWIINAPELPEMYPPPTHWRDLPPMPESDPAN